MLFLYAQQGLLAHLGASDYAEHFILTREGVDLKSSAAHQIKIRSGRRLLGRG